jgi:hypothetical protein
VQRYSGAANTQRERERERERESERGAFKDGGALKKEGKGEAREGSHGCVCPLSADKKPALDARGTKKPALGGEEQGREGESERHDDHLISVSGRARRRLHGVEEGRMCQSGSDGESRGRGRRRQDDLTLLRCTRLRAWLFAPAPPPCRRRSPSGRPSTRPPHPLRHRRRSRPVSLAFSSLLSRLHSSPSLLLAISALSPPTQGLFRSPAPSVATPQRPPAPLFHSFSYVDDCHARSEH